MTTHARLIAPVALALLGAVSAPSTFAQQETPQRRQDRQEAQRDQVELQRELQKAREKLQEAAREVARLSGQIVNPVVKEVTQRFRVAPPRGVLGLAIEDTDLGVRVTGVTPNGAGADAGITVGDTIVAIEGAELVAPDGAGAKRPSPSQLLLSQLGNVNPGDDVELRILRNGDYRTVHATVREPNVLFFRGPGFELPNLPNLPNPWPEGFWRRNVWADLQLATLSPGLGEYFGAREGLLVVRAPKDSSLGLKDGDVILEIGGRKPTSPEHAMRILASFEPGENLRILVMRHQKRETVEGKVPTASTH